MHVAIVLISCVKIVRRLHVLLGVNVVVFNVIRVHIVYVTIIVGVANILGRRGHTPNHCVPTKHFQKLATMYTLGQLQPRNRF